MNPITGYRELTDEEIALVNRAKEVGESVGAFLNKLQERDLDPRWLSIAKTHMQQGFMALVRSITKPETFS